MPDRLISMQPSYRAAVLFSTIVAALALPNASAIPTSDLASGGFTVGPTSPGKWGSPTLGTGATVTYSYMAGGISLADEGAGSSVDLGSIMPAGYIAQIDAAFAAWSAVANINFIKVEDNGLAFNAAGATADIRIGAHYFDGPGNTLAHAFFPPTNGASAAGDIHFDADEFWKIGFGGPGFDIFQVATHEIGHAIGLDHTPSANTLMNAFYSEGYHGLQDDDIAAAQYLYGPRIAAAVPDGGFTVALLGASIVGVALFWRKSG